MRSQQLIDIQVKTLICLNLKDKDTVMQRKLFKSIKWKTYIIKKWLFWRMKLILELFKKRLSPQLLFPFVALSQLTIGPQAAILVLPLYLNNHKDVFKQTRKTIKLKWFPSALEKSFLSFDKDFWLCFVICSI